MLAPVAGRLVGVPLEPGLHLAMLLQICSARHAAGGRSRRLSLLIKPGSKRSSPSGKAVRSRGGLSPGSSWGADAPLPRSPPRSVSQAFARKACCRARAACGGTRPRHRHRVRDGPAADNQERTHHGTIATVSKTNTGAFRGTLQTMSLKAAIAIIPK